MLKHEGGYEGGGRGGYGGGGRSSYTRMSPKTKFMNYQPPRPTPRPSSSSADYSFSRRVLQNSGDRFGLSIRVNNSEQSHTNTSGTRTGQGDNNVIRFSERYQVPPRFQKLVTTGHAVGGAAPTPAPTPIPAAESTPVKPSNAYMSEFGSPGDRDPKSLLHVYFAKNKLGTPMFSTSETEGGFICHVKVKGKTYGSKSIVKTKKAAEHLAAKSACEDLGIDEVLINSYTRRTPKKTKPVSSSSFKGPNLQEMTLGDEEIEEMSKQFTRVEVADTNTPHNEIKARVRDLIATKPSGMFGTRFPVEYMAKYGEDLPHNYDKLLESWTDVIQIEESAAMKNLKMYYPVTQSDIRVVSLSSPSVSAKFEKVYIPPGKTFKAGDKLKVYISHTLHCNEFYVQEETSCINKIMQDIREHYESRGCPKEIMRMEEGGYCVAQFSEDMNWYRSQIISTRVSGKFETEGEVLYVDFGNTEFIPKSKMRRMLSPVAKEPMQAIKCSLHGVTPTQSSWSAECINEFCKLAQDQLLTVEVLDVIDDTCDVILGTDLLCINDVLVEKGFAKQRLVEPDTLVIPEEENLDIFVSFIHKTTDIMVRLVGKDYSESLEDLEGQMEAYYTKKTNPPSFVRAGTLYASVTEGEDGLTVNRVRAIHVDGDKVEVSYMDHGGSESVQVNQLRTLDNKFRKLPYQAITISLAGLEEFETNEDVLEKMLDEILGKVLVAQVVDRSDRLSVNLFDTSTQEVDVNITEILMGVVSDQDLSPQLPMDNSVKEVYIIHIDPNGLFHVQVPGPGLQRLEVMMAEISAHFSQKIGADEFISHPEPGQIVCARYQLDSRWYRAEVLQVLGDRMVEVFYVDYGNSEVMQITQLRKPDKASPHIASLPHQALQCTLYGLPPPGKMWTKETVKTLEDSIDMESFVPIKTMKAATDDSNAEVVMFLFDESASDFIPLNEDILDFGDDLEAEINSLDFDELDDAPLDETAEAVYAQNEQKSTETASGNNNGDISHVVNATGDATGLNSLVLDQTGNSEAAAGNSKGNISKMADKTADATDIGLNNWLVLDQTGNSEAAAATAGIAKGNISKMSDKTADATDIGLNNWLVLDQTGNSTSFLNTSTEENNNGKHILNNLQNIPTVDPVPSTNDVGSVPSNSTSGSIDSLQLTYARTKSVDSTASYDGLSEPLSSMRLKYYHKIPMPMRADVPEPGSFFDVHVAWACDPSNFALAPYEGQSDLETLMSEIYYAYQDKWQHTNLTVFHKGQLYAAFHENLWYRVMVHDVLPDQQTVSVQFVDYGDFNMLPTNTLQPLPGDFRELPLQAIRAELSGICPIDGKAWTSACETRFGELMNDRDLVALIKDNSFEGGKIKVKLIDTSEEETDVCIDDVLVKEGYAKYV